MGRRDHDAPAELEAFCVAEYPRLVGSLALYCGDAELAEDLAQEALARACRDWPNVRRKDSPGAWAHRVGINLANSHFRRLAVRRRYRHRVPGAADRRHHDPDAGEAVAVREAVAALPRRKRTALILRYFRDLSVADTAAVMGEPESTIKTLTRRALADLERALGDADGLEAADVR